MLELKKEGHKGSLKIKEIWRNSLEGQKLMKEIYKQRFETYTSLGLIPFSKEKSKMVKDEFDESPHTTHFVIIEDGRVIGSHRATKYSPEDKLPSLKEGYIPNLFWETGTSISELSRLVVRQDRKYPGCVLQLAYNAANYTLNNLSELIYTIGNPEAKDLFEYMGAKQINAERRCVIDQKEEKMVIRGGIPMIVDKPTLNHNIPLDKYKMDRMIVILKINEKVPLNEQRTKKFY